MKKLYITLSLFAFVCYHGYAQNFFGIANSNFGGTNGLYFNPASIADSRNIVYLNLFAVNLNATNNYLEYKAPYTLFQLATGKVPAQYLDSTGSAKFKGSYLIENAKTKGKDKSVGLSSEVRGTALLVSINRKNSIAISSRVRMAFQISDVNEELINFSRSFIEKNPSYLDFLTNQYIPAAKFSINANAYAETGLSYGRVLYEKEKHFLKGGITVKKLTGLFSLFILNNNMQFKVHLPDTLDLNNPLNNVSLTLKDVDIKYGYSNVDYYSTATPQDMFIKNPIGSGWGIDLGFIYEYRPDYKEFQYRMDNKDKIDNRKNKYKYRLGVSLMDVGGIKYKGSQYALNKNSRAFTVADTAFFSRFQETVGSVHGTSGVNAVIDSIIGIADSSKNFTTKLPSTLNLMAEARIFNHFCLNFSIIQALRGKQSVGIRQTSSLALTPRIEYKWIEFSMPIMLTYDYTKLQIGSMLRLGPLFIGSDNMGGLFGWTTINGFDIYAGLSIPICKGKPHDKDKDGISNRKDKCKSIPGVWAFKGCPDTDGDSIPDMEDHCPTVWGLKAFHGCPDTDGDGITDSLDECPDVAGLSEFHGCPDTDGDGIPDKLDSCPDVKGPKEFNGCPDKDGDGVMDKDDECPDEPGLKEFNGCPDKDKDGVPDAKDKCPDIPGPVKYDGCPDRDGDGVLDADDECPDEAGLAIFLGCPDRDMDGVPDKLDSCPDTYGTKENHGCPLVKVVEKVQLAQLTKEEQAIVKTAFDNLEFEAGKAVIAAKSLSSIDTLAQVLMKKKEFKLYVSGHTDNVGKPVSNQKLSESRAKAIKEYLVNKGIAAERIFTEGFGDKRPIAPNTTPEGKQKNRRVELKIIK